MKRGNFNMYIKNSLRRMGSKVDEYEKGLRELQGMKFEKKKRRAKKKTIKKPKIP